MAGDGRGRKVIAGEREALWGAGIIEVKSTLKALEFYSPTEV